MNKAKKIILFILMLSFVFQISFSYEKPKKIVFSTSQVSIDTTGKWLNEVYTEAFRRLGIEYSVEIYPGKRAAKVAASGIVDGEIERVYNYLDNNEELVRVEENTRIIEFATFSFDQNIELDGWDSLKGRNYIVGYRLGVKLSERELKKRLDKNKISSSRDIGSALEKLIRDRIDIYVGINHYVQQYINSSKYKLNKTLYKVGVMEKVTAHAYLHKKHKELEPELSQALADMKREGLFTEYMNKYNQDYEW